MPHDLEPAAGSARLSPLLRVVLILALGLVGGCESAPGPSPTASPTVAVERPTTTPAPSPSPLPAPAGSPSPSPSPGPSPSPSPSPAATASPSPSPSPTAAGIPSPEASPAVEAPAGWASVTDPNGRWRIEVPLSWRREIRFSHGTFTAPYLDAIVTVRILPLSEVGGTRDLTAAATAYVETMGPPVERPRIEGIDRIGDSPAGTPRVEARYTFERRGRPWNATAILDQRGNSIYVIDVATARDQVAAFAETVQHMIASVRFF